MEEVLALQPLLQEGLGALVQLLLLNPPDLEEEEHLVCIRDFTSLIVVDTRKLWNVVVFLLEVSGCPVFS